MAMMMPLEPNRRQSLPDPLSAVLQPPQNETPADRDRRLFAELEAKRVSDNIDEMLKAEKKEKRMKPEVKVLLLGQSESGKSTTLKRESLVLFLRQTYSPLVFALALDVIYSVSTCAVGRALKRDSCSCAANHPSLDADDTFVIRISVDACPCCVPRRSTRLARRHLSQSRSVRAQVRLNSTSIAFDDYILHQNTGCHFPRC